MNGIQREAGRNTKTKKHTPSNRNSIHNLRTFISLYDLLGALNHSVRVQSASPIITQTRGEQTDRRTAANYCSEFSLIHYFAFINLDGCLSAAAVATASNCKKQDRKANSCDSHLARLCFLSRFRLSVRLQYLRLNLERDPVVSRPSHQCWTPGRSWLSYLFATKKNPQDARRRDRRIWIRCSVAVNCDEVAPERKNKAQGK